MKSISELRTIVEEELAKIEYPKTPSSLYDPIRYTIGLKGKRMRSILVLMSHQLFDKNLKTAIQPALAIEVFHNFTLIHDDIMDKAPLRRGQATVHEKWDKNIAILSGDTMLIHSYQLISTLSPNVLSEIIDVFNQAAINVCEGQRLDIDFETRNQISISDYLHMIEQKTAVLFAAALKIGGITSKRNNIDQNHLYEFGRNLGIAFQLKDDLLDAFGSFESFGKKVGGDILANKKTYLYLKALEIANTKQQTELFNYYSSNNHSPEKVKNVIAIFKELNIYKLTVNLMKKFHKKAMEHLCEIDSENKKYLIAFSDMLLDRIK